MASQRLLFRTVNSFVFVSIVCSAAVEQAYVVRTSEGKFQIKSGVSKDFVAEASFANGINETG